MAWATLIPRPFASIPTLLMSRKKQSVSRRRRERTGARSTDDGEDTAECRLAVGGAGLHRRPSRHTLDHVSRGTWRF